MDSLQNPTSLCQLKVPGQTHLSPTKPPFECSSIYCRCGFLSLKVVIAQVVDQWHSIRAGWVGIPGQTWRFYRSEWLSIYSHRVLGFF